MTDADELEYLINRRSAMQTTLLDYLFAPRGSNSYSNSYNVMDASTLRENIADLDRQILTIRERTCE